MSEINLEKDDGGQEENTSSSSSSISNISLSVNLLGYQVREELAKSSKGMGVSKPILISLALIGLALLINVVSYLVLNSLKEEQIARKDQLEARKTELENKMKELTAATEERDIAKQKRNILVWATGSGNSTKFSEILEELRSRIPANVWVSSITISDTLALSINGETFDHRTAALFLANLQDSPTFTNVELSPTKKDVKYKLREFTALKEITENEVVKTEEVYLPKNLDLERKLTSTTTFSIKANILVNQTK